MNSNTKLAVAIATILGGAASGAAFAAGPVTVAQANSPTVGLYISGSSAAKNAVLAALETDLCAGSYDLFSSTGNTNFYAVSCIPASGKVAGANGANVFTVWYRAEGGSVTGALPLVSGSSINQLNLGASTVTLASTGATTSAYTITVTGSSAANGFNDSFTGGGVIKEPVQFGITDVEPSRLIKDNYPTSYSAAVYGTASPTQLASLSTKALFQQVFGVFVNTSSSNFSAAEKVGAGTSNATLSLSKAAVTNLLNGTSTDWSVVEDTTGAAVSGPQAVTIVNREAGSGSRTATSIYFTDDICNSSVVSGVADPAGAANDYFSTGNVLAAANNVPGSITYASIDSVSASAYPNLTLVAVNGIQPTNLNAALGLYDDWFEATGVVGSGGLPSNQTALVSFLVKDFSTESTAPHAADILAIPSGVNVAALPVSGTANTGTAATSTGTTIYINPYTRAKNSCSPPSNAI